MTDTDQILRALIIEDDVQISRSIARALKAERFACHLKSSATADLDFQPFYNCRLVIVGFQVVQSFHGDFLARLRRSLPGACVLLLSVCDDTRRSLEAYGFNRETCVKDPYNRAELAEKIARAVHRIASAATVKPPALVLRDAVPAPAAPPAIKVLGAGPAAVPPAPPRDSSERRCKVVVVGSGKDGTGKSTVAMHLISALLHEDQVVSSLDLDAALGTLTRYVENRRANAAAADRPLPLPKHSAVPGGAGEEVRFEAALMAMLETSDYLIIDTPGGDSPLSRMAHAWADSLITPINDSFIDLEVLAHFEPGSVASARPSRYSAMVHAANDIKIRRDGRPIDWIVLRNRLSALSSKNKLRMSDALAQLAGQLGYREGPGLSERVIYRELFNAGLTLADLREEQANVELTMSHVAARQELRALRGTLSLTALAATAQTVEAEPLLQRTA